MEAQIEQKTKIFIDESGKSNDHPILIGGVMLPEDIYLSSEFSSLQGIKTHWVDFSKKSDMQTILQTLAKYVDVISWNVINYNYCAVQNAANEKLSSIQADRVAAKVISAKFPERLIYGLLREAPNYLCTKADIVIEESSEYKKYLEETKARDDLNVQGIYRGENFVVDSLRLEGKGKEIGLEVTDLLLGIMRHIIRNPDNASSKRNAKKTKFVINMLKNENVMRIFAERGSLYEWHQSKALQRVDFNKYVESFKAKHHAAWFTA